jgi:hypothetical protein
MLRSLHHGAQPREPNEGAARINDPPTGGEDTRFGLEEAPAPSIRFDPKFHRGRPAHQRLLSATWEVQISGPARSALEMRRLDAA